ncbi:sugar phosphorylase [Halobacillus naozhouensis]|uniref:Sucrose phosphorylase n=1 Tax=Halobacillus naozhouensis TaxID=554880 RepID=A0ABY8IZQ7_9BACI|nr:sugar phosphorylase [Halobacillus naozhouensis]WFT74216.1 sugar phosphorylase [Halobacillus naozhouensis]
MVLTIEKRSSLQRKLSEVYGEEVCSRLLDRIEDLMESYANLPAKSKTWVDEQDVMLISYGDSLVEEGKAPLQSLQQFLEKQVGDVVNAVHLLPFYPYSSDDGFSVIDYLKVNPELGGWSDVHQFAAKFDLMFDAVINHISQKSEWFQEYVKGNSDYRNFFIEADPNEDYSSVVRPRALPLLTEFQTNQGSKHVWTTFSEDQIDLNYKSEDLLITVIDILLKYVENGARFLRLDAIGFLWKQLGTSSIHLEETHKIVQVMREVLENVSPGTIMITETNVPHKENISYFGNGHNEAHMVYQFPLPPLTLHALQTGDASKLSGWAQSLEATTEDTTFFNFLASHDGIGVRPVEGILSKEEVQAMVDRVQDRGGFVSYKDNGDGTKSPYELNINYLEALSNSHDANKEKAKRFMAAQSILLSMAGVPGIYIHSLLGSTNDLKGVEETGRYRSINRETLNRQEVEAELSEQSTLRYLVFNDFKPFLHARRNEKAFAPNASQEVVTADNRIFSVIRTNEQTRDQVQVFTNVSNEVVHVPIRIGGQKFTNLLGDEETASPTISLQPYEVKWMKPVKEMD